MKTSNLSEIEADIYDLERAARLTDHLLANESLETKDASGNPSRVSFTPSMFDLVQFACADVVFRTRKLRERVEQALEEEVST